MTELTDLSIDNSSADVARSEPLDDSRMFLESTASALLKLLDELQLGDLSNLSAESTGDDEDLDFLG